MYQKLRNKILTVVVITWQYPECLVVPTLKKNMGNCVKYIAYARRVVTKNNRQDKMSLMTAEIRQEESVNIIFRGYFYLV